MSNLSAEQELQFQEVLQASLTTRNAVYRLRVAGWTIEPPPEPRYYVQKVRAYWNVTDRHSGEWVAHFNRELHPNPETSARDHCEWLNAEWEAQVGA